MSKEFKKSYMHPTRRKLVDMVHSGEYEKPIISSTSNADSKKESTKTRKVGEVWTDSKGITWEQKNGYRVRKSERADTMAELRKELEKLNQCQHSKCKKQGRFARYSHIDKQLIKNTGYCQDCIVTLEHQIRVDGLYIPYENFKVMSKMLKEGTAMLDKLQEAYDSAKQEYEYVDSDGKVQKWKMERPVDELKAEIQEDIDKLTEEVELVKTKLIEVHDLLKHKNYELVERNNPIKELMETENERTD